jgi:hypothetical protein
MFVFKQAKRKQAKLRLALTGPSGAGKTYSALMIAKGMGGKIAVIDTERGSSELYDHLLQFDALQLEPPYSPERYIQAINAAVAAGYTTLIIDSATHVWNGIGGCLEINEQLAAARFKGNTWSAWNETTPRYRAFIDAMLQAPIHIIATTRSKTETAQQENNGRKSIVKLGMKAEQRDGFEYEFTVVLDLVHDGHYAVASKDRTGLFTGQDPQIITADTGAKLLEWLNSGESEQETINKVMAAIENADTLEAIKHHLNAAAAMHPHLKAEFTAKATERKGQLLNQPAPTPTV